MHSILYTVLGCFIFLIKNTNVDICNASSVRDAL